MPLREFDDSEGVRWRVWDVVPDSPGILASDPADHDAHRSTRLTPGLEGGWLAFEHGSRKRRLSPIPPDWERLSPEELERLRDQAREVPRRL
jgi:hypothetical protein